MIVLCFILENKQAVRLLTAPRNRGMLKTLRNSTIAALALALLWLSVSGIFHLLDRNPPFRS
jgi:hypothetical protein